MSTDESTVVPAAKGPRRPRRRLILAGVLAVVVLAAAGVAVVSLPGGSSGPKPVAAASTMSAIRATAKSGTRPFTIKGTLTAALAAYFGGSTITGQGIANFSTDSAKWSLNVPDRVGATIAVFAQHDKTYVDVGTTGRWVVLQSRADYTGYDQVPLVRDLIVLTNPFRALNLVESTPATPHAKPLSLGTYRNRPLGPAMQPAAYTRPLSAPKLSTDCNNGAGASTDGGQSAEGTPDQKALTADFSVTGEAEAETLKSWYEAKVTADSVDSGACTIDATLENVHAQGFDIKEVFNNPIPQQTLAAPNAQQTYTYSVVFSYHIPCNQGVWTGTDSVTPINGYVSGAGTSATIEDTPASGGGELHLTVSGQAVTLTTKEKFTAEETSLIVVDKYAIPTPHPVTYTRAVDAGGAAQFFPSGRDVATLPLNVTVSGPTTLTEQGSEVGPRDQVSKGTYYLGGTINCEAHTVTLESSERAFGTVTLSQTAFVPPVITSTQNHDWRGQILNPTPSPNPTLSPSATASAPVSVPPVAAAGVGESQAIWAANHKPNPSDGSAAYDPIPGAFPGAADQDRFQQITFYRGALLSYFEKLSPTATQTTIDSTMVTNLGAGTSVLVPFESLGRCGAAFYRNPAAISTLNPTGIIQVLYRSDYDSQSNAFDPASIKSAQVTSYQAGAPPKAPLPSTTCI